MRTEEIKIYKFNELPESSKENARNWWRGCDDGSPWASENQESLNAFMSGLNCELRRGGFIRSNDSGTGDLEGLRLYKYLMNNHKDIFYEKKTYMIKPGKPGYKRTSNILYTETCYPFTGYCMDESLLQPIKDFLKKPGNVCFNDLLTLCYESYERDIQADEDYRNSDEYIDEMIEVNGYEFYENGKIY